MRFFLTMVGEAKDVVIKKNVLGTSVSGADEYVAGCSQG
jgi:hypothetical protein